MRIGIIGYGTMGKKIEKSIYSVYGKIIVSNNSKDNIRVAKNSNTCIFLCVKPKDAEEVCEQIKEHIIKDITVISIMAGIPLIKLRKWLNHEKVIKMMPTILDGPITVYNPNKYFCPSLINHNLIKVENEDILDLSTSASGCMPGFLAKVFEIWINEMEKLGIPKELAEQLVCGNISSFSAVNKLDLQNIQKMVSSEGGATELGIRYLNWSSLDKILLETMKTANNKVLKIRE